MATRKTQPVARALYLTRGESEHELSFWPGEALVLLRRVDDNWYEGQALDGQVGIFPANRVRVEAGLPSSAQERGLARSGCPLAVARYAFAGDEPGDLGFDKGQMVELLESVGGGWIRGRLADGQTGIFPDSFVEVFRPLLSDVSRPNPAPRRQATVSSRPKPKPRPRTRRFTDPVGVHGLSLPTDGEGQTGAKVSPPSPPRPASSRGYRTGTAAAGKATRRSTNLASLDQQLSSLQSSLQVERKMLRSAQDLLKLASVPEKREKLAQAVTTHEQSVRSMEQEIFEIEAQRSNLVARSAPTTPTSPRSVTNDVKLEQHMQRKKALAEMVETEINFCHEMEVFCAKVLPAFKQWSEIKWEDIFGNIEEVTEVSSRLSVCLQKVREEESWTEEVNVGTVLQSFVPELLRVYGPYCRTHDNALQLLEKLMEGSSRSDKMKEMLQLGRPELQAWSTQSLLIKPVQRVLQYPLLLDKLLKSTPIDHAHHKSLVSALSSLNQLAQDINEFKRRKDIVDRYTGASRPERSDRGLIYSMRKKARRMQQNITQLAGLRSGTVDPTFDEEEQRLLAMESCLRSLQRNATTWKEETEHMLACRESLLEAMLHYSSESSQVAEAKKFVQSTANAWKDHWQLMKEQLMDPLQQLLGLFRNPLLLVAKRKDKLLDYDSLRHDMERTAEQERLYQLKEQCTMAKRMYEALNAQLLEELPQFTTRVGCVASHLLHVFLGLQTTWHQRVLDLLANDTMTSLDSAFTAAHAQALASISRRLSTLEIVPAFLLSSFGKHQSAEESTTPPISPTMERSLPPQGKDLRQRFVESRNTRSLDDLNKIECAGDLDEHQAAVDRKEADRSPVIATPPPSGEVVLEVLYNFAAQSLSELSVGEGEKVRLVCSHDSNGSKEWCLVRNEAGQEGYVAASYLNIHLRT